MSKATFDRLVAEKQRAIKKCIGRGAHEPNEPELYTKEFEARKKDRVERHKKFVRTWQLDTHNHAKLAFYAEVSPSQNPIIAGFAPENCPLDILQAAQEKQKELEEGKKRRGKKGHHKDASSSPEDQAQGPATKKQRATLTSEDDAAGRYPISNLRGGYQPIESVLESDEANPEDKESTTDEEPTKDASKDNAKTQKDPAKGFAALEEQLAVQESDHDTNDEIQQEEHFHARPAVKIEVSDHLKSLLVDDWENVTKNLSLVPVPAGHPVSEILSTYFEEEKGKRRLGSAEADLLEEVVQGTKDYFEKCLGKLLLYRFEREQYFRVYQAMEKGEGEYDGKSIADIYGAEHLCRLFGNFLPPYYLSYYKRLHADPFETVSLPELIAQTNMDAQSVSKLRQEIQSLTAWLGKNSTRFFVAEYEAASQEYIEKARGL